MKRWIVTIVAMALLATVAGLGSRLATGTSAQPSADDLAATVAALETRVAGLEQRVAALEGDTAGDAASGTPEARLGTRSNPLTIGKTGRIDGYVVRVVEVIPDGTDLVLAENQFNERPAADAQFHIVVVEVTYVGDEIGDPAFDLSFKGIGNAGIAYDSFAHNCGVVPNDQYNYVGDLLPGDSIRFNVCWTVPSAESTRW